MTVDVYAPACGRYIESRWLPFRAASIRGNNDVVVALIMEPVPHLKVLRWVPAGR